MEDDIKLIISRDSEKGPAALKSFLQKGEQAFSFPELNRSDCRQELWKAIFDIGQNATNEAVLADCFAAIRILSREKTGLNELVSEEWLKLIQKHSGLDANYKKPVKSETVAVEALKALCNIVFNSPVALTLVTKNGTLDNIVLRIQIHLKLDLSEDIKYFDMKLLFVITTLCSEIRYKVKEQLHGISYLIKLLNAIHDKAHKKFGHLSDKQVDILCEILKTLYNLTINQGDQDLDDTELQHFMDLATAARKLFIIPTQTPQKRSDLINHTVNLLTNLPVKCFTPLIVPVEKGKKIPEHLQYEKYDMTAINSILQFLQNKFSNEPTVSKQHELLSPVLTALIRCAAGNRLIRKYLRRQILPPLKDVHTRPEEGSTLRNCLCRLLTSPITHVKDLSAEFLFILCKHSVNRMIKYTGYGNAAGLFANRGLLGGKQSEEAANYSSDSEDSETDEYREHKHGINPVMGCYEAPRPDPTASMTEEQKEYEAMKLVQLMDDMTRSGVVKPCKIGEDGRPEPIDHVLQLQEGLPKQQVRRNSDSDSD